MASRVPVRPFSVARLPKIEFGPGRLETVPAAVARLGRRCLLVTGAGSFRASNRYHWLVDELGAAGVIHEELIVSGEPSPALVDEAVARFRDGDIEVVLGIGGGSVLDTAKAVAGLLRPGNSVLDHLEGVGPEKPYLGPAVPWIAVPTTAGTGSEATKNAVLSVAGRFKKSFRDERLVATEAILDPDLLATCPPQLVASNGMDALTQLLESYVSLRAGPLTDALALDGLAAAREGLLAWHRAVVAGRGDSLDAVEGRERMAYAALLSGITLAQAGLGAAHGLASPLGAFFPISHGVACGATLVASVEVNISALEERDPSSVALGKYAVLGRLLARTDGDGAEGAEDADGDDGAEDAASGELADGAEDAASARHTDGAKHAGGAPARRALVQELNRWRSELGVPGLRTYGVTEADVPRIVAESRGSSMRTNPIVLTDDEIARIVLQCL